LIINGRKSIGLTSILDDNGVLQYFRFVFVIGFISLDVDEILEVVAGFRIIALSYAWLLTEQRTIGSGIAMCVTVYRRFDRSWLSSDTDDGFFVIDKLLKSDCEFVEYLYAVLFDEFALFLIIILGRWWKPIIKWS
jgi:hypothetical protein